MKEAAEGVVKFTVDHGVGAAPRASRSAPLRAWFRILRRLELLGRRADRYEGFAYGNLSRRTGDGLLVTCTQTSGRQRLAPEDFTRVTHWSIAGNRLRSTGPCRPSSETLTHAMVYDQVPAAHWVFHVHSPEIWQNAAGLGLPVTDPGAEYGTPAMARAVAATLESLGQPATGILAMGGHEDGIVAWGATADEAGCRLLTALAHALERQGG